MTPEAQNRAIAEAVGWTDFEIRNHEVLTSGRDAYFARSPCIPDTRKHRIPDFCADLNAMRSALMTLSDEEWIRYEAAIFTILEREGPQVCGRPRFLLSSAPQQAEAFCRVKYPESFTPTGT